MSKASSSTVLVVSGIVIDIAQNLESISSACRLYLASISPDSLTARFIFTSQVFACKHTSADDFLCDGLVWFGVVSCGVV